MDASDISLITTKDLEKVFSLLISLWGSKVYSDNDLLTIINNNLSYCIRILGDIIAICFIRRDKPTRGTLFIFAVKKEYQRKGLGTKLLSFCINKAKENGLKSISLHVQVQNEPAINLYKKCGFTISKTTKKYYSKEDYPSNQDAYLMTIQI